MKNLGEKGKKKWKVCTREEHNENTREIYVYIPDQSIASGLNKLHQGELHL